MAREPAGNRTTKASEFKARCLMLMDEVAQSGDGDIIDIRGDIVCPPDVEWEAEVDPARVADP